jgi:hypothetical protein
VTVPASFVDAPRRLTDALTKLVHAASSLIARLAGP